MKEIINFIAIVAAYVVLSVGVYLDYSERAARDTIPDLHPVTASFEDETISIPSGYKFLDFKRDNGSVSILTREAEGDEGFETYYIIESNGTQTRKILVVEEQ